MATYLAYHFHFQSPLHLGRSGIGLEVTAVSVPADTLFSAICQAWSTFYGVESLQAFLGEYMQESAELPFALTSGFPFAGEVRFYPKPGRNIGCADKDRKKVKQIQFVSAKRFQQMVDNESIEFSADELVNGGTVWIHSDERPQLQACLGPAQNIWETDVRPRVTIDRQTSSSEIWHQGYVKFNQGCGLWFGARFRDDTVQAKIETLLRVLGDTGIGGERTTGCGFFSMESKPLAVPEARTEADQFVTLAPICPRDPNELQHLTQGKVNYTLEQRAGWTSSLEVRDRRRKRIWLFADGSVLNWKHGTIGRLVDLTPDSFPHPIYRYGYGWPVQLR